MNSPVILCVGSPVLGFQTLKVLSSETEIAKCP